MLNFLFLLFFTFLSNYDDCSPPSSIDDTIPKFEPYPVKGLGRCKGRSHEKTLLVFGFCPNYISPHLPPPNLDNLYNFFWTPKTSI